MYNPTLPQPRPSVLGRAGNRADRLFCALLVIGLLSLAAIAKAQVSISHFGTYATGSFNTGAAEIADFDPVNDRIWFTNAQLNSVVGLNATNPASLSVFITIPMAAYGGGVNSVVVIPGGVAVAMEAVVKTDPGRVVFFDVCPAWANKVPAGERRSFVSKGCKSLTGKLWSLQMLAGPGSKT